MFVHCPFPVIIERRSHSIMRPVISHVSCVEQMTLAGLDVQNTVKKGLYFDLGYLTDTGS